MSNSDESTALALDLVMGILGSLFWLGILWIAMRAVYALERIAAAAEAMQ